MTMTKRLHTAEKVLEVVLEDCKDDQDYNDQTNWPWKGSDNKFSDFELEDDFDTEQVPPNSLFVFTSFTIAEHTTTALAMALIFSSSPVSVQLYIKSSIQSYNMDECSYSS